MWRVHIKIWISGFIWNIGRSENIEIIWPCDNNSLKLRGFVFFNVVGGRGSSLLASASIALRFPPHTETEGFRKKEHAMDD